MHREGIHSANDAKFGQLHTELLDAISAVHLEPSYWPHRARQALRLVMRLCSAAGPDWSQRYLASQESLLPVG